MHPRTAAALGQLREAAWFANVGVKDTDNARVLTSWSDAVTSCSTPQWIGLCHDAVDAYCDRLQDRSPKDFARWNDVVLAVRPAVLDLVTEKTAGLVEKHNLPKEFRNAVGWDMLHLAMECEFADIYPPGFFASQAYWYQAGHFPCGWEGPFPDGGRLVIY